MTSGIFDQVLVDSIIVNRQDRDRSELTDIDELATSIRLNGLIHPLIITRENVLITGERRLTAVKQLGWTLVSIQYVEDLTVYELKVLELEENIRRVDLPWKDKCLAVVKYHNLQTEAAERKGEEWSYEETGEALGLSRATVHDHLAVGAELQSDNQKIIDSTKYTVARGMVRRKAERQALEAVRALDVLSVPTGETEEPHEDREVPLLLADFLTWAPNYRGGKFNFIHCDFPYGIGASNIQQGSKVERLGGYKDDPETFWELLRCLTDNLDLLLEDSAHIMFWFSMDNYEKIRQVFEKDTDFKISPFPLVWHKSDNAGILPDYRRGPRRTYETAFIGSRGDRKVSEVVANSFSTPTTKLIHMSEKPMPLLRHFFRLFVDEFSHVLDPTCGSGNAIKVAQAVGAKSFLGIEKDEDFYNLAKEHFYD